MSVKREIRASKRIRKDIDEQLEQIRPSRTADMLKHYEQENKALSSKVAALEQQLEHTRKAYQVRISERDVSREECLTLAAENDRNKQIAASKQQRINELERRWQVVSLMLHELLPNEADQAELKELIYQRNENLRRPNNYGNQ